VRNVLNVAIYFFMHSFIHFFVRCGYSLTHSLKKRGRARQPGAAARGDARGAPLAVRRRAPGGQPAHGPQAALADAADRPCAARVHVPLADPLRNVIRPNCE